MARRILPERWRPPVLAAATLLALGLGSSASATAAGPTGAASISGRYRVGAGALQRGGRFQLRAPDAQRVSLRLELPESPLLAAGQLLLREGDALLSWTEPLGGGELLAMGSDWRELLAALPVPAWAALLSGDGRALMACFEAGGDQAAGADGWCAGRLAGYPLRLRLQGGRILALRWALPGGELRGRWRELAGGGGQSLLLRGAGRGWLRVSARPPRRGVVSDAEWLFVGGTGNLGPAGGVGGAHP